MQRQSKRARLIVNSWYIGAGNRASVFTRKSSQPFEKMKEIYGEDMNRLHVESREGKGDKPKSSEFIRKVDNRKRNYLIAVSFFFFVIVLLIAIYS
ncbi:MAG: hypothetical protein JXR34_13605 [Bacteroidales bacterium]|nr:hypothetical protein [Bacteroidales bacterium]